MDRKELPGEVSSREWGWKMRDITHGYLLENRRVKVLASGKVGMLLDWEGLEQGGPAGSRGLSQGMEFPWRIPIPANPKIPGSPTPLSTCFPSFSLSRAFLLHPSAGKLRGRGQV